MFIWSPQGATSGNVDTIGQVEHNIANSASKPLPAEAKALRSDALGPETSGQTYRPVALTAEQTAATLYFVEKSPGRFAMVWRRRNRRRGAGRPELEQLRTAGRSGKRLAGRPR